MYTVSELSKQSGVSRETIRYYTKIGLIHPTRDPDNGYRYFTDKDAELVSFTKKAKSLGLSLSEVAQVIEISNNGESPCELVQQLVRNKLWETRNQINELLSFSLKLEDVLKEWSDEDLSSYVNHSICPLIERRKYDDEIR